MLAADRFAAEVREDERRRVAGITAVPFFVVDRTIGASGAQSPQLLRELLDRAWEQRSPLNCAPASESCGRCRSAALIASLAAAAEVATAQGGPRITASRVVVISDAIQTVRGRNWPVIEFCLWTVRVSVRSPQNSAPIAQRHVI